MPSNGEVTACEPIVLRIKGNPAVFFWGEGYMRSVGRAGCRGASSPSSTVTRQKDVCPLAYR